MKNLPIFILTLLLFTAFTAFSQETKDTINRRIVTTSRIVTDGPTLDGIFDEPIWNQVEWSTGFEENEPDNGAKATQETAFKILYDDKFLYVAYQCFDTEPDSIVSRMSRRDGFEGDWVEINIDSYHDLQSAYSFTTTVAGVKGDESITNQFNWDSSWNPIWYLKTKINDKGWTAEIKIPFSQLRFSAAEEQVWGIQVNRRHFRDGSRSTFQGIPNSASYWVRGFAELHGIRGIKPQKQREIQPYVVVKSETYPSEEGNPFADGSDLKLSAGVDGKIGITNNMILDFTINPDFGQVEADPSQLRLDGFEQFFEEQRPFFIEGNQNFNFRLSNMDVWGGFNSDRLFYSRRIGSNPKNYPDTNDDEYVDIPANSTILGAAKVSGRTKKGLSIGILESITQEERAIIDNNGERREEMVEPLTSYFVGRVKQDYNDNNTTIGASFNAVNRNLGDSDMREWLTDQAYTGGVDILHKWKDQTWQLQGSLSASQVMGTQSAILSKQTDFLHAFDRPDADHLEIDSTATSMFGHAGSAKIARYGGKWRFSTGVTWRSPKLDLNDLGFMSNTDEINHVIWGGYRLLKPTKMFNSAGVNFNNRNTFDFSGRFLAQFFNVNGFLQFKNFWNVNASMHYETKDISRRALFGGPALNRPRGRFMNINLNTDQRKKISFNFWTGQGFAGSSSLRSEEVGMYMQVQPTNAFSFSIAPSYSKFFRKYQHIPFQNINDGTRYVGGSLNQRTLDLTLRLNYNITPNLTIQYYGAPFITHGVYSDFKNITKPLVEDDDRFEEYGDEVVYDSENDSYYLDRDKDGVQDCDNCDFENPDFSFIQFRSNMVARWEYTPGSELFLVWSQNTTNSGGPMDELLPTLNENLFQEKGRNIFLVKWTYRFIL